MGAKMLKFVLTATLVVASHCTLAQIEQGDPLSTQSGWQVGGQISTYHYEEPNFALLEGERGGAVGAFTHVDPDHVFTRIEGRVSYGLLSYAGSGYQEDNPDLTIEIRALVGKDFTVGENLTLSPHFGLGFRYLYSDIRGYSSTNSVGYRRYSQYIYAPLGVTLRMKAGDRSIFVPTFEYDAFIAGNQYSQLTDTGLPNYSDISNSQSGGYGYRIYLMLETGNWSFGPWLHYWSIEDSDVAYDSLGRGWLEPANWTREYGFELRRRF